MHILVLCSGNICRSPMGEGLLGHRLRAAGVEADVTSAGFLTVDRPPEPEVVDLMRDRDVDVSTHRSRILTPQMMGASDLVIGMAREHIRDAVMLDPEAFGRTFTLKELVRRGESVGGRGRDEVMADWLRRVSDGRTPGQLLGESDLDDVPDPMGRRFKVFRGVAEEIDDLTDRLVSLLVP